MNEAAQTQTGPPALRPTAPRPRRRGWRVLWWLVIFSSGLIVGSGLTLIMLRQGALNAIHHPEAMPAKIAQRLQRPLGLTPQQRQRVEQILAERQVHLQDIRRRFQPEMETELDVIRQQVGEVLNEKQRLKWEAYFDHARSTWLPEVPPSTPTGD